MCQFENLKMSIMLIGANRDWQLPKFQIKSRIWVFKILLLPSTAEYPKSKLLTDETSQYAFTDCLAIHGYRRNVILCTGLCMPV